MSRQVLRTCHALVQLAGPPFGAAPVSAAGAASTRCPMYVRHLPVAGRFI